MGIIRNSQSVYENLRKYNFHITIENGMEYDLKFKREQYHHLAGFQHLTDLPDIANPKTGMQQFYSKLKSGKISEQHIESSTMFCKIKERIASFDAINTILSASDAKVIVEFDPTLASSLIPAKLLLFQRDGTPFSASITYYSLFMDYLSGSSKLFPLSFLVEHSTLYVQNQKFLNCSISCTTISNK